MITSLRNPRIAEVRRLQRRRERRATGQTTIEGPFLLDEAMAAGVTIREVFVLAADRDALTANAGLTITDVSEEVLSGLASSVNPRGPIAVIDIPPTPPVQSVDSVVLWEIGDPGNVGTIIRTAAAFGFQVVATVGSADLWSPKVLRAGAGGHFRTPIVDSVEASLEMLARAELVPLATAADGVDIRKVDLADDSPVALIVGNEANGVPDTVTDRAATIAIPMPGGSESLNAAVAAGVLMYLRMSRRP